MYIPESVRVLKRRLLRRFEGEKNLRQRYAQMFDTPLKATPELEGTFTAKLFHRLIYLDRHGSTLLTRLTDKCLVRDWVKERIGGKHLVDLLWMGANPHEIPFEGLPEQCIVKTNHGSGMNIIITRPFDRYSIVRELNQYLSRNYYWVYREAQYLKIKPRMLIEAFVDDRQLNGPLNYRFWCFDGRSELISGRRQQAFSNQPILRSRMEETSVVVQSRYTGYRNAAPGTL